MKKRKVYDYYEAQKALGVLKPRDLILYPNGGFEKYPAFEIVEAWMDKHFEYVAELKDPSHPIWQFRITGILRPQS